MLHLVLERAGELPAALVTDSQRLAHGRIYVAPPDHHMLIEPGSVRVGRGPKENRFRPAIDPLFRSAAQVYGPRVIGVILSGSLDDGTSGLWAVKKLGGVAIVQDPEDAAFPSMPRHAMAHVAVDYTEPVAQIAPLLARLTATPVHSRVGVPDAALGVEVQIATGEDARDAGIERLGAPSTFACPDCHGVLLRLEEANRHRYRCFTGHAYSSTSLASALNEEIDRSLWIGIRTLDEAARVFEHMASHHQDADRANEVLARSRSDALSDAEALRVIANRRGRNGTQ